jgi:hypothetical protein
MSEFIVPAQAHGRKYNSGIAPHPVLLPMGEGQGEGSNRRYAGAAAKLSPAIHGNGNVGTIR